MASGKRDPQWKEKVLEWQASGKSIRAWCLEKHIPVTTFYGWKARLQESVKNKSLDKEVIAKLGGLWHLIF